MVIGGTFGYKAGPYVIVYSTQCEALGNVFELAQLR